MDAIADGVWLICEESFWGTPAHLGEQQGLADVTQPIVELFSAETAALLAWTDYALGERLDAVHPRLRQRLRLEVDRRVLTPALERDDFWWLGFTPREVNNWNPWINSNWLTAVLLLEQDPARRARAVTKIARSLDRFVDAYPDDGGCDEGPGYWGRAAASLFEALELLSSATGGRVEVWREPIVGAHGPVHRARVRQGRVLRRHRRRPGEGAARAGARVPLRSCGRRPAARGLRRVARQAARALRARRRRRPTARRDAACRPSRSRARSPRPRPRSRSTARRTSPTCSWRRGASSPAPRAGCTSRPGGDTTRRATTTTTSGT